MSTKFGDEYFADAQSRPPWHQEAEKLNKRLQPLLRALNVDGHHQVEQIVRSSRGSIHAKLRASTQLGRGESGGMRVTVNVSDRMPPPVLERLSQQPDALLWVLFHRAQLAETGRGLNAVVSNYDLITGPDGFPPPEGLDETDLQRAGTFFSRLNDTAAKRAEQIVEELTQLPGDVLGAYFFRRNRIELYWVVIWIIASHLDVAVEDLAIVVLAHELAHLYTHVGQDADGADWDTTDFANCELHIVEGLAQFYTEIVCTQIAHAGNERPLNAFQMLLKRQAEPYVCFNEWADTHKKRAEVIRRALVTSRTHRLTKYAEFLEVLGSSEEAL